MTYVYGQLLQAAPFGSSRDSFCGLSNKFLMANSEKISWYISNKSTVLFWFGAEVSIWLPIILWNIAQILVETEICHMVNGVELQQKPFKQSNVDHPNLKMALHFNVLTHWKWMSIKFQLSKKCRQFRKPAPVLLFLLSTIFRFVLVLFRWILDPAVSAHRVYTAFCQLAQLHCHSKRIRLPSWLFVRICKAISYVLIFSKDPVFIDFLSSCSA